MNRIIRDAQNTNGVCLFKSVYMGGGIYDVRFSAKECEVGDFFEYHLSSFSIEEIKDQRPHKTGETLNCYDCLIKDAGFISGVNYIIQLPTLYLPEPMPVMAD